MKFKHVRRFVVLFAGVFALAACKSSANSGTRDARGSLLDLGVRDARGSQPPPPPSFSVTPKTITHLASGLPLGMPIVFHGTRWQMTLDAGHKELVAGFRLLSWPDKTPVVGSWTFRQEGDNASWSEHIFTPTTPLVAGEYLIALETTATLKAERHMLFHVGSLPRVLRVVFEPFGGGAGAPDTVALVFSEPVKVAAVVAGFALRVDSKTAPEALTSLNETAEGTVVGFRATAAFDTKALVHLELAADVGLPALLDSAYQGQSSTLPFKLSLKPGDATAAKPWQPDVTIDAP